MKELPKTINRVEVIDHTKSVEQGGGRHVIYREEAVVSVSFDIQDEGRTLKVFIERVL